MREDEFREKHGSQASEDFVMRYRFDPNVDPDLRCHANTIMDQRIGRFARGMNEAFLGLSQGELSALNISEIEARVKGIIGAEKVDHLMRGFGLLPVRE